MVETLSSPKRRTKPDLTLVKPPGPGTGHNSKFPDKDRTLVFIGRQMELDAEKRALAKKQKDLGNQITNAGLTYKAVREGMNAHEGDPEAILKHYSMVFHVTSAMGSPVATQLNFFPDPASKNVSRQTELEMAYDKGKILALLGKDADEQAFASGDLQQEHLRGWNDGQAFRRDEFQRNAEAVNEADQKKKDDAAAKAKKIADKATKAENSAKGKAEKLIRKTVEDLDVDKVVTDTTKH